jgi:ABC-2 type transport system ATP-binding protein
MDAELLPIALLEDITVSLRPVGRVLDRFSLGIQAGEVVALLGENGRGKTTLLRIAGGLLRPDRGKVSIMGVNLGAQPRVATAALYSVIEPETPYDFLTFRQYAAVHRAIYRRWNEAEAQRFCTETSVPLDQALATLSRGQRLKARLACAFASGAQFLVLDEPFETLDTASRGYLKARLVACRAEGRSGILYSAHRDEDAKDVATSIVNIT